MMSEWKEMALKALTIKIGSGATPTGGSNNYKQTGISLIRSQNVLDFEFSEDGLAFIDDAQADELSNVKVKEHDVLLNITGDSVARCCIVPASVLPARVNQHVAIIRSNPENADYRFLHYSLLARKEELLTRSEIGATRRALTKSMLEQFPILAPSLSEQAGIAEVLCSLDDKIDLLHRQNKTLEAMAETLFRQWFVEEASDDWQKVKLGDFFPVVTGKKDANYGGSDGSYPFFTCSQRTINAPGYSFDAPAILLSGNGDFNIKRYIGKFEAYQRTYVLVPHEPRLLGFLFTLMQYFLHDITEGHQGSVINFITKSMITDFEFRLPKDWKNRSDVFDHFTTLFEKHDFNSSQIRTLEKLRDTLLPKLMSGEVRVQYE